MCVYIVYIYIYRYVYIYIYVCIFVCVYIYIFIYLSIYLFILYIYIYITISTVQLFFRCAAHCAGHFAHLGVRPTFGALRNAHHCSVPWRGAVGNEYRLNCLAPKMMPRGHDELPFHSINRVASCLKQKFDDRLKIEFATGRPVETTCRIYLHEWLFQLWADIPPK